MVSFTGGVPTGQAVMATAPPARSRPGRARARAEMTRPSWPPTSRSTPPWPARLFDAAFVTSGPGVHGGQAALRPPGPTWPTRWHALVDRLATEVVGDGLADGVTMGPVHLPTARDRVEAMHRRGRAGRRQGAPSGRVRAEDAGAGGYLVSPALVEVTDPDARIVREEQFAPALPVLAYDDLDDAVTAANDTSFGLCASIWSDDADAGGRVARPAAKRGRSSSIPTGSRPSTWTRPWAGGSSRASASSSVPRACGPSPASGWSSKGPRDHPHTGWHGGRRHRRATATGRRR